MEYEPLNNANSEIRILQILPDNASSKIGNSVVYRDLVHCTLTNVSLNDYTTNSVKIIEASGHSALNGEPYRSILANRGLLTWHSDSARWNWGDFAALSYTWGDPTPLRKIVLNGAIVEVRENMEAFLQQFRHRHSEGGIGLWIDALCINQMDIQERNFQVKLMRDIYEQALVVYAWLGLAEEDGPDGMDLLLDVSKYTYTTADELSIYSTRLRHCPDLYTARAWRGFYYLVMSPYWKRLWIIQELALGHSGVVVLWGNRRIGWVDLCKAIDFLSVDVQTTIRRVIDSFLIRGEGWPKGPFNMNVLLRLAMLRSQQLNHSGNQQVYLELKHIFSIGRGAQQSDPRDKVYALLALMAPSIANQINPNYSAEVLDIYTDFAKKAIDSTGNLDIICQARADLLVRGEFATWVPDWSTGYNINVEMTMGTPYQASGDSTPKYEFIGQTLKATGFIVDCTDGLGGLYKLTGQEHNGFTTQPRGHAHSYGTPENAQDALWRTMLGNRDGNGGPVTDDMLRKMDTPWPDGSNPETSIIKGCFNDIRKANETLRMGDTDFKTLSSNTRVTAAEIDFVNIAQDPFLRCYTLMIDRRLIVTGKGRFGLAAKGAEQGDIICILFGCTVPVLLRTVGDGSFWLVGEIYVHGIMEGEAMLDLKNGEYTQRDFVIS
ncbi:heterokaryon incompatibility protein-domain-containing protein [Tricladium varicosporioides]|nr:heterokaryon incompatibility protein-domain-containing protein [Hymenoscyphus varicosporioides]